MLERQLTLDTDGLQLTNPFLFAGLNGTIFVVDIRDPNNVGAFEATVTQFDSHGQRIRTIGHSGRGPGEYRGGIGGVAQLPDGRILLSDYLGLLVFSAEGRPLDRWSAPYAAANTGSPILVDPTGFVYVEGAVWRPDRTRERFLYRFRFDGTLVDSVADISRSLPAAAAYRTHSLIPFFPRHVWAWSPLGYYVTALTSRYAVDLRLPRPASRSGLDWRPEMGVQSIRHVSPAVSLAGAEREDWKQWATMSLRAMLRNEAWSWEGPEIPALKPFIRDLQVDLSGRIWVRLFQESTIDRSVAIAARPSPGNESAPYKASERWPEPRVYDVFEPSGTYVGRVRMPDKDRADYPHARYVIRADTVWAVTYDQDETPFVSKFVIRWK